MGKSVLHRVLWEGYGESQALAKVMTRPFPTDTEPAPTARRQRAIARRIGGVTPPAPTKTVLAAGRVPTSVDNREARRP